MTAPLTDDYLAKAERDARRFQGAWTGTAGTLAAHVMRLLGEVKRLKAVPPPVVVPPLVEMVNRRTAAMLAGNLPATDRNIYVSQDAYGPHFVRNPSCWLNGVTNLTCFSPAQMSGTPWHQRAGTLVTRRHVVYASHFGIPVIEGGTPIHFVARDNAVITRRLVAQVADAPSDIAIGLLDEPVPQEIDIAPVLPPDFATYLGTRNAVLAVTLDAEERASVQQVSTFFDRGFSVNTLHERWVAPEYQRLAAWSEATVTGDSGNPAFLVIGNELVLLGCFYTAMGGPHLGARHEQVNRMIEQLAPGYRLTTKIL